MPLTLQNLNDELIEKYGGTIGFVLQGLKVPCEITYSNKAMDTAKNLCETQLGCSDTPFTFVALALVKHVLSERIELPDGITVQDIEEVLPLCLELTNPSTASISVPGAFKNQAPEFLRSILAQHSQHEPSDV